MNTWKGVALFGENKLPWLRKFFPYKHGTPVPSTLSRLFVQLDNEKFGLCFIDWIASLSQQSIGDIVSIDGKRMRGSYDKDDNKAAIHMVSAFASELGICLGQLATDQKSNEITAIPQLLEMLTLKGAIVTTDAMGCQRAISEKILEKEADYILQVKGNQEGLLEQIKKVFAITAPSSCNTRHDIGHGRIEMRSCRVIDNLEFFDDYKDWPGLISLVEITAQRTVKNTGETQTNTRYYISSKKDDAKKFNRNIRSHWGIENKLHWVLDVNFKEDMSRKRKGESAENFGVVTKIALNLLALSDEKLSKNNKRHKAMLSDQYREQLLGI